MKTGRNNKPDITGSDFIAMCIAAYQAMAPMVGAILLALVAVYVLVMLW